jgi:hypothetical protein
MYAFFVGFSLYNKTKWKGAELRLQLAKENFLTRFVVRVVQETIGYYKKTQLYFKLTNIADAQESCIICITF